MSKSASPTRAAALMHAAARLADLLDEENAALAALDVPRATRLVDAKTAALSELQSLLAQERIEAANMGSVFRAPAQQLSDRLHAAIATNRRLLERAIQVQGRIIGMIARAMPRAIAANAPRYGAKGSVPAQELCKPIAVSSRA